MELKDFTLLYVEDDTATQEEIVKILETEVKELYVASDGEEGLELYKKHSPDIVMTDIVMPKMDGLEMTKSIKEIDYHQPVIILTSYSDNETLKSTLNLGVDKYITKPILDIDYLLNSIETVGKLAQPQIDPYKIMSQSNISMILTSDNEGGNIIIYANDAFYKLYGFTKEECIGKNPRFLHAHDNEQGNLKVVKHAVGMNESITTIIRNYTKDGVLKYIELSISPIYDKHKNKVKYFLGIHKDVTKEQKILNDLKNLF